jgi:hypothetical protein
MADLDQSGIFPKGFCIIEQNRGRLQAVSNPAGEWDLRLGARHDAKKNIFHARKFSFPCLTN